MFFCKIGHLAALRNMTLTRNFQHQQRFSPSLSKCSHFSHPLRAKFSRPIDGQNCSTIYLSETEVEDTAMLNNLRPSTPLPIQSAYETLNTIPETESPEAW